VHQLPGAVPGRRDPDSGRVAARHPRAVGGEAKALAAQLRRLRPRLGIYITFIIDDPDTMLQRLVAAGCEMLAGPEKLEVLPGTFFVFCRDPQGNVLEFVQFADVSAYRPDLARGH
jgi:predicted enzyme related to lactoylglutathione lyase